MIKINKAFISLVVIILVIIICDSKATAENLYPPSESAYESLVTWSSLGTYKNNAVNKIYNQVDEEYTYNSDNFLGNVRIRYKLECNNGNYILHIKEGSPFSKFIEISDEYGVIYSQTTRLGDMKITLPRLSDNVIIKCGVDSNDYGYDYDSGEYYDYRAKYVTLSVSKPLNLATLNLAKLEISNAFVAPDNTIHKYYPAIINSDGTYTYPRFIKYSADGTTVLDYYAAYTYDGIDPKVISGPKRTKYVMEYTPLQGDKAFAMGQIDFGNNEFGCYTLQRNSEEQAYLQQFDWDASKGQFGPSKIPKANQSSPTNYVFPIVGKAEMVCWYGVQGTEGVGYTGYTGVVTKQTINNGEMQSTGNYDDDNNLIYDWVITGTSNIVQLRYITLWNVYSSEYLGQHYKWRIIYYDGSRDRTLIDENQQFGNTEAISSSVWNSAEGVADREWREVNYMLVKSGADGNNWALANAPIGRRFEVNGIRYANSNNNLVILQSNRPTIDCQRPTENQILINAAATGFLPQISVSDPDNDILTCKCYIDFEISPRDTQTISNTNTPQFIYFRSLDTDALTEGLHVIKFIVSDGINTVQKSINFSIDRTPPSINVIAKASTFTSITLSTSATDSAAGLAVAPYRYTLAGVQSPWTADSSYTAGSLLPNTQYAVKVEAMDAVGNVSSKEEYVYTQAQIPVVSTNTPVENSLNIAISDMNPAYTQYQLMFGSMYVSQSGTLTNIPAWITVKGKAMSVTGLTPNTAYQIKAKAKNGDGVETAFSSEITGTTLATPPANVAFTPAQTTMTIRWDAVPNALSYNVEKDGVAERNITATSYTHTGLTPETSHNYRISVNTAAGTGSWSSTYTKATYPYPPVTPVSFAITDVSQKYISLSWDPSVKASGYVLEANGKEVGTYTTTTAVLQNLTPNTQYKFRIKARNAGGDSEWSDYLTETTWPVIPEIPSNVTVRKTNISADITWNSSERAEGYEIEADGMITDLGNELEHLHEGLTALSAHTYRVRAYNRGGKSEWSQLLNVTTNPDKPGMPNNIMATTDKNYTTLTWYLVPYAEKYDIEIDSKDVRTVTAPDLSARIDGLQPGTTHTYRVSARNVTGSSDWSDYVTVSTLPESDQAMTSLTNVVAVVTSSYITISWDDVDTNAEYLIEVDGVLQDIGKDRVYNHTGLSANQYHTYKVKAKTTTSQEYWCAVLSLSTLPDPPNALTGVEAAAYDNQIELKWDKADDVTYDIEVDGQTIDNGENSIYTHQNLNPGTEHTYRVRAKNATGVTAWSTAITKSTTLPEYTVKCSKDSTFDFSILASNVQDFTGLKFVITYNESDLDIEDLCSFTPEKDTANGAINGTKLTVTKEAGKLIITVKDNIVPGTSWSGELDNIIFKSKTDGETKISVTVDDK